MKILLHSHLVGSKLMAQRLILTWAQVTNAKLLTLKSVMLKYKRWACTMVYLWASKNITLNVSLRIFGNLVNNVLKALQLNLLNKL